MIGEANVLRDLLWGADERSRTRGCYWASIATTATFPSDGRGGTDTTAANAHIQGLIDAGDTIRGVVIVGALLNTTAATAGACAVRRPNKTTNLFSFNWDAKTIVGPSKQGWFIPLMRDLPHVGWNFSAICTVAGHAVDLLYRIY